jgi:hypothetical protein
LWEESTMTVRLKVRLTLLDEKEAPELALAW